MTKVTTRDGAERGTTIDERGGGPLSAVERAIRYPAGSDDVVRTVAIGGVLSLLGFLLVPLVFLAGYGVRVLERTSDGYEEPPAFDEWGELAVTGVQATAIAAVYALVPAVVGGGVLLGSALWAAGDGIAAGLGVVGAVAGGLLWFGLSLLVAYLLPAALTSFARTHRMTSGFDADALVPVWRSRTYALGWATAVVVVLIGGLVAAVLNVVPVLGAIAGAFVAFYAGVAAYSVLGRTWADATAELATDDRSACGR